MCRVLETTAPTDHLVFFGLRHCLEGVLFGIPDNVVGFHHIGLAYY